MQINFLMEKIQQIKKAKAEGRLLTAIRRHSVPKFWKRFKNTLFYRDLSKEAGGNKTDVCFTLSHKSNSYFGINLPLIRLDEKGKFIFPKNTKRVMIDVGTAPNWPNSVAWLNRHPNDSVIIGIEPNIDSWCIAKSVYFFANQLELIDGGPGTNYVKQEHTDRIFFIPAAVGNFLGYTLINSNKSVGSSSILKSNFNDMASKTVPLLTTIRQNITPVIKLEEVLKRMPEYIDYIEHLKVDTEGFDFEVVKSAGDLIKKCAVVTVEVGCYNAFSNAYIVKDMLNYIKSKGFRQLTEGHGTVSFINVNYRNTLDKLDYEMMN